MREKLAQLRYSQRQRRITPAYAGKTRLILILCNRLWDHPRVCGKNFCFNVASSQFIGSPPRMREKH